MELKNIVIVGGGFGGVGVAKHLVKKLPRGFRIILIDPKLYHVFHPDLYRVVTSRIPEEFGPLSVDFHYLFNASSISFFDIFLNDLSVKIVQDTVVNVDVKRKKVSTALGANFNYEYLVVATGSQPDFFGIPRLSEISYTLQTPSDALNIRNAIDELFIRTSKQKIINIIIVGGGFTGCEVAGALNHYVNNLSRIHAHPRENYVVAIVEADAFILRGARPWVRHLAKKRLEKLGVKIFTNKKVEYVTDHQLITADKENFAFDVLIWTAGVSAGDFGKLLPDTKIENNNTIIPDEYLRLPPYENIFGVGDIVRVVNKKTEESLPMAASVAIHEAKTLANNILRHIRGQKLKRYRPHHPGFIVSLGEKYAIVDTGIVRLAGFAVSMLQQLVTLHYYWTILGWRMAFIKWRQRFKIYG